MSTKRAAIRDAMYSTYNAISDHPIQAGEDRTRSNYMKELVHKNKDLHICDYSWKHNCWDGPPRRIPRPDFHKNTNRKEVRKMKWNEVFKAWDPTA